MEAICDHHSKCKPEFRCKNLFVICFVLFNASLYSQNIASYDNLIDTVVSKIRDQKLVGIGEATHGTSEFFNFKSDVFKQLVIKKGFTVFILEASFTQSKAIDAYINGLNTIPIDSILLDYDSWPWHTEEFKNLIIWMKNYNDKNDKNKIRFYGMDFQYSGQLNKIIYDLTPFIRTEDVKWLQSLKGLTLSSEALNKIDLLYSSNKSAFVESIGLDQFLESRHEIAIIRQKKIAFGFHGLLKEVKGNKERDYLMSKNIAFITDTLSTGAKCFIWAHNGHVAKSKQHLSKIFKYKPTGYYLNEQQASNYYAIGTSAEHVKFNALDKNFRLKEFSVDLHDKKIRTNDAYAFQAGKPSNKSRIELIDIGAFYGPGQDYKTKVLLSKTFDGLVTFKETNFARPLKR